MDLLLWIILFSLIGGILSVMAAASFLLLPEKRRAFFVPHLVSFAVGTMLGASFLGLLPHAMEYELHPVEPHYLGMSLLLGLISFFLMEKMVLWRHCHSHHSDDPIPGLDQPDHHGGHQHKTAAGHLILIGDGIHNFIDGILIAAAFLTDVHLGIVTALAIAAHEIPQELGDFVILLHSGFKRAKALYYNLLSSVATTVGAVLGYFALAEMQQLLPYVLVVAASSFIYVAVADLIPGLHTRTKLRETAQQVSLILAGIALIYITHSLMH